MFFISTGTIVKSVKCEDDLAQLAKRSTLMVLFTGPNCAPCEAAKPIFRRIAETVESEIEFVEINLDEFEYTEPNELGAKAMLFAASRRVKSIPSIVVIKQGKIAHRQTGMSQRVKDLADLIEAFR